MFQKRHKTKLPFYMH